MSDTIPQRSFGLVVDFHGAVAPSRWEVDIDPGPSPTEPGPAQIRVACVLQYGGQPCVPLDGTTRRMLVNFPSAVPHGPHRYSIRAYDLSGTLLDALSGQFVLRLDEARYHVQVLPGLNGTDADAGGVTALGDVAGWALDASGLSHAVIWHGGTVSVLGSPAGETQTQAADLNDRGDVVGCGLDTQQAIIWANGVGTVLNQPCAPGRINSAGTTVFSRTVIALTLDSSTVRFADGSTKQFAFWANALNDSGDVVGSTYSSAHWETTAATRSFAPQTVYHGCCGALGYSGYTDINDSGIAVGWASGDDGSYLFRSTATQTVDLTWSLGDIPLAINAAGSVLAFDSGTDTAFLWTDKGGLAPAGAETVWGGRTAVVSLDDSTWRLDTVHRMNANGWITAHGTNLASGVKAALLLVPAP